MRNPMANIKMTNIKMTAFFRNPEIVKLHGAILIKDEPTKLFNDCTISLSALTLNHLFPCINCNFGSSREKLLPGSRGSLQGTLEVSADDFGRFSVKFHPVF
jgi:hypothetical protein